MAINLETLASDIMTKFKDVALDKKKYEIDAFLNLRYLQGDLYYIEDGLSRVYKEYYAYLNNDNILKENYNVIDSVRREYVSRLTRTFPLIRSEPETQDYSTKTKALITNKILEKWEDNSRIRNKYRMFCDGLVDTGTCGFLPFWDVSKGDITTMEQRKEIVNGKEVTNVILNRSGDVGVDLIYFWEMYPDSVYSNDLDECRWFIRARAFEKSQVEDTYGKRVDTEFVDRFTQQPNTYSNNSNNYYSTLPIDHVMIYEYYEKPSTQYPKGLYAVVVNNQIMTAMEHYPYDLGYNSEHNFGMAIAKFTSRPKEFFGDTIISYGRSVQRNVDGTENLKRAFIRNMSINKWFYEEGSLDNPDDLDSTGTTKVKLNMGRRAPEQQQTPGVNGTIFQQGNTILDTMSLVTGVSKFKLGGNPSSAQRSGAVFEKMSNRDTASFSGTITNIELVMLELYKMVILLYKKYVPKKKWIADYDDQYNMLGFKYSDILEDLKLTNKGLIGLTEDEERQMLSGLVEVGFFNRDEQSTMDAQSKQNLLLQMKLGSISELIEDPYIDQVRSQDRETEDLSAGNPVSINDYDNHKAHVDSMEKTFNSAYWYTFKRENEENNIYKSLLIHYNEHRAELSKAVQSQMLQAQVLEGKK